MDLSAPFITKMILEESPTSQSPWFKLFVEFSELVRLNDATTTSESPPEPSATVQLAAHADSAAVMSLLSNRLVLTNTAVLNMSFVSPTLVTLPQGQMIQAGSAIAMWFVSWPGAHAAVYIMGSAYQDVAGNVGTKDMAIQVSAVAMPTVGYTSMPFGHQCPHQREGSVCAPSGHPVASHMQLLCHNDALCLQVSVPGSSSLQRVASAAVAATVLSAASALSSAAAAATSSGATSLVRSIGHTQFLAMSVSLAVPWLPHEYLQLCDGLE